MAAANIKYFKRKSRRKIAAVNFLSNISLDGTHKDTKYAMFNRKHHRLKEETENADLTGVVSLTLLDCVKNKVKTVNNVDVIKNIGQSIDSSSLNVVVDDQGNPSFTITPTKLLRTSSVTTDREKPSARKKLASIYTDPGLLRENLQDPTSRLRGNNISAKYLPQQPRGAINFFDVNSRRKIGEERVVIVSKNKAPMVICSTLPYSKRTDLEENKSTRHRHISIPSHEGLLFLGLHAIGLVEDGQDVSYSQLLVPSHGRYLHRAQSERGLINTDHSLNLMPEMVYPTGRELCRSHSHDPNALLHRPSAVYGLEKVLEESSTNQYDPKYLDDPELQSGSYRTLLTFTSYMTSVIDYVKPSSLKKELNEKFREKNPNIQLTLTKLRSLKRELKLIAYNKCNVDLWVVAVSYVYFEKLILKLLINKQNRKLCAGACLTLSAKLNDVKGSDLTKLIEQVEDDFRLHRKELLTFEFACLVALEFSLHLSDNEIYPHYQRLLFQS